MAEQGRDTGATVMSPTPFLDPFLLKDSLNNLKVSLRPKHLLHYGFWATGGLRTSSTPVQQSMLGCPHNLSFSLEEHPPGGATHRPISLPRSPL